MIPSKFSLALTLLASVGLARADFSPAYDHAAGLLEAEQKLTAAGMSASSTEHQVSQILATLLPNPNIWAPIGSIDFSLNYLMQMLKLPENKIRCANKYTNSIVHFHDLLVAQPNLCSAPLAKLVEKLYSKVTEFCLMHMSANKWANFEASLDYFGLSQAADLAVELMGDEFDEQPELQPADELKQRLERRLAQVAAERNVSAGRLLDALGDVSGPVGAALDNLGHPIPMDRLSERVRKLYIATLVNKKLGYQ